MRHLLFLLALLPLAVFAQGEVKHAQTRTLGKGVVAGSSPALRSAATGSQVVAPPHSMIISTRDVASSYRLLGAPGQYSASLQIPLDPRVKLQAEIGQQSWQSMQQRLKGGEVGASYNTGGYSFGLSVGAKDLVRDGGHLPRVLPRASLGVGGLSDFSDSTSLNAKGRIAIGGHSGFDFAASMGKIRLLPGNSLGVDELDQKSLSFGVDHGMLSGSIIGRSVTPMVPGADRRWNSIDLGVTWRLPWRGSFSVGAQNIWSSGASINTPIGPEPDQSPKPYVQYHQEL